MRFNHRPYTFASLAILLVTLAFSQWHTARVADTGHAPRQVATSHVASAVAASVIPEEPTTTVSLVTRVVDGDTIIVSQNGTSTRVRLIGVDTPETVKPHTKVQCFGPEASAKTKEMLTGVFVHLETDPSQDLHDTYGRLLAYVFLPNGALFNEYLIENGFGREYTFKGRVYHYQARFKAAQATAKSEKRGMWAPGACAF